MDSEFSKPGDQEEMRGLRAFEAFEGSGAQRAAIEAEFKRRVEYWTRRVECVERRRIAGRAGFIAGAIIIVASLTLGPLAWAFAIGAASWMIWRSRGADGGWRRLDAQIRLGHCPSCGYELGDVGPGAVSAGPPRCPECGLAWPRVPPAVPPTSS